MHIAKTNVLNKTNLVYAVFLQQIIQEVDPEPLTLIVFPKFSTLEWENPDHSLSLSIRVKLQHSPF